MDAFPSGLVTNLVRISSYGCLLNGLFLISYKNSNNPRRAKDKIPHSLQDRKFPAIRAFSLCIQCIEPSKTLHQL